MSLSYTDTMFAPGLGLKGSKKYITGRHILLSHSAAYHLYDKQYRKTQNGNFNFLI